MPDLLKKIQEHLGEGKSARSMDLDDEESLFVKSLDLLSYKPIIYAANVDEDNASDEAAANNEYVNAIINYKSSVAKENGIDVSVYSVSDIAFPDNVDFCSLIGNMFDNAIQGAAECKGSRMIKLDISRDGDGYRILMCNGVPAPVLKSNPNLETTKKDRGSHGFGTKIIRQIADKYNGTTDFYDAEGGKFCCSVVVYPEIPVKGTMG